MGSTVRNVGADLGDAIKEHNDPETVAAALPSYLIFVDSVAKKSGSSSETKLNAAHLYLTYASLFVDDTARQKRLIELSLNYITQGICQHRSLFCELHIANYKKFEEIVAQANRDDVSFLYELGIVWASWIKVNADDWSAVTQLAQVKRLLTRVIEIDERFDNGGAHLVLGILNTLVPPSMGGKSDVALAYFRKAIEMSNNRNLSYKVALAEHYARLVFDRQLHDRVLKEVITEQQEYKEYNLVNTIAKRRAGKLLLTSDDYF